MPTHTRISALFFSTILFSLLAPFCTLAASFSDVRSTHPDYQAIEFLKSEGTITGYKDGTFRPDQLVSRAEAVKMILSAKKITLIKVTSSSFKDVKITDWFTGYIETAKSIKIVTGNPDGYFAPGRSVNKVEFLKMLLLAYDLKFLNYQTPSRPLYKDTIDTSAWYTPYLDFAKNVNIITPDSEGRITPSKNLTRAEVAEIIYKLQMIIKGGPTQLLLTRAESSLLQTIFDLRDNQLSDAAVDVKTAGDLANQALQKAPDQTIAKAAVKVITAFDLLVKAHQDSSAGNYTQALKDAGDAYNFAEDARQINPSVDNLVNQVKSAAKSLADSIRSKTKSN